MLNLQESWLALEYALCLNLTPEDAIELVRKLKAYIEEHGE